MDVIQMWYISFGCYSDVAHFTSFSFRIDSCLACNGTVKLKNSIRFSGFLVKYIYTRNISSIFYSN